MESAKPNDLFQENKSTLEPGMSQASQRQTEVSSVCIDLEWAEKNKENHHNSAQRVTTKKPMLWICINIPSSDYLFIYVSQANNDPTYEVMTPILQM